MEASKQTVESAAIPSMNNIYIYKYFLLKIGFSLVNIGNTCKQCDNNK